MLTIYAHTEDLQGASLYTAVPYDGLGIAGADAPATGTHGASPIHRLITLPGDAANEYRWRLDSVPAGASNVVVRYDSALEFDAVGDGEYVFGGTLFENGASLGSSPVTVTIGAVPFTAAVAGNGAAVGALTTSITLSAALAANGDALAALATALRLAALGAGQGEVVAALLAGAIDLVATVTARGEVSAALDTAITLSATPAGAGDLVGQLVVEASPGALAATVSGTGQALAELATAITLHGIASGAGEVTARLAGGIGLGDVYDLEVVSVTPHRLVIAIHGRS